MAAVKRERLLVGYEKKGQAMTLSEVKDFINAVGFPIASLFGMGCVVFVSMRWLGNVIKQDVIPAIRDAVKAHTAFVSEVEQSVRSVRRSANKTYRSVQNLTTHMEARDERFEAMLHELSTRPGQMGHRSNTTREGLPG